MKKALLYGLLFLWVGHLPAGSAEVIYQENFDHAENGAEVNAFGWRIHATPEQSTYIVRDGVLEVTCWPETYHGGYAEVDVPLCRKGVFEFDAHIALRNPGNAQGLALTMDLYNVGLWWHDYCGDWRRYFPEPVGKRQPGFDVEPVGHQSLGPVDKTRWHHYKVFFDTDRDLVEYYLDDLVDPVRIDAGVAVLGRCEWQGGAIRIGNMGITNGPVVYGLDNFVLQSLDPAEEAEATEGGDCLVFRGLAFERYRLSEALAATGEKKIRKYSLLNWRSPPEARNTFKLDRLPSSATVARARSIILVDMPAGPDGILPDFLLRQMADRVRAGGRLIVLGGLLTLEKGNYQGTPLEPVLPVELSADVWRLRPLPEPVPLQPQSEELAAGLAWEPAPCVLYRHDLPLREGTEVLLKAGDQPLLVKRSYGEGEVFVFLGAPCGTAARALRFWEWPHWPTFLARVIAPGGQE